MKRENTVSEMVMETISENLLSLSMKEQKYDSPIEDPHYIIGNGMDVDVEHHVESPEEAIEYSKEAKDAVQQLDSLIENLNKLRDVVSCYTDLDPKEFE